MPALTELIAAHSGPFHTYEFFPPRTEAALVNLLDRVRRLSSAPLPAPLAVSVTWGAGGSTAERSLELAEHVSKLGLEVVLHLTCTNMARARIDGALARCRALGIRNVLALRGDPPRAEEYGLDCAAAAADEFSHAADLVRYIRATHGDWFCIGVAGYPTPHPDSASADDEVRWLKHKCDAGADFIITQLFYDVDGFTDWVARCRAAGIAQPILPGILPIQNYASFKRLTNLTKVPVPPHILADLEPIRADDAAVKKYGAQLATAMVRALLASGTVRGVHLCTLNLEKSVRMILENVGWADDQAAQGARQGSPLPRHNQLIADDADVPAGANGHAHGHVGDVAAGLSISPQEASQLAEWGLTHHALPPAPKTGLGHNVAPSTGAGTSTGTGARGAPTAKAGEDSWDEYPNGRFTDVRSPAYGEIDGWGSGLKASAAAAVRAWGTPSTTADLSALFTRYLRSDRNTPTTPFCDEPLSPETATILGPLLELNSAGRQRWTVGSQPAVDAARSEDPTHGWGPPGGYVFQKAYVEFFTRKQDVDRLRARLAAADGADGPHPGIISMYAANRDGGYVTNTQKDAVNAVTWAAFPGQEIVQSTIIEEISFLAWKEEAFEIWSEWARLYPRDSPAHRLLDGIGNEWWLVSLIHHDYKDADALWRFLLDDPAQA
ncbi:methylenetetrahydrofolate reductase 1 [Cryptotrichosporon argae]